MWGLAAAAMVAIVLGASVPRVGNTVAGQIVTIAYATVFVGAAATLLSHRPDNPVSWLLAMAACYFVVEVGGNQVDAHLAPGAGAWWSWFRQAVFAPTIFPLALLPLVFPEGRPPTRRWNWAVLTGVVAVLLLTFGNAVASDLLGGAPNPAAVVGDLVPAVALGVGVVAYVVAFVAGVVAVVRRTRRATGIERQQLRWLARAAMAAFVSFLASGLLESIGREDVGGFVFGAGLSLFPVAVTVAVLRYRLYDLDRIVSRSVTYTAVVAVLVGVYAALVLGLSALVRTEDTSNLVVAGSTLAVAALFRPLRFRVQRGVDRRFNRSRYDAGREVEAFGARLRDEISLSALADQLQRAVHATVQPEHARLWLPGKGPG